jgi:hypothetical protein
MNLKGWYKTMKKEDFIKLGLDEETATKCAAASADELKTYIPKVRFDEVNIEKKNLETDKATLTGQLETLRNSTGDVETLKTTIATLQADNATKDAIHAAEINQLKADNAITAALTIAKAKNPKAVKALLELDPEKIEFNEDGTIKGLDEQIKKLTEAEDSKFLFDVKQESKPGFKGLIPGEKKDGVPGEAKAASLADALKLHYETNGQ